LKIVVFLENFEIKLVGKSAEKSGKWM